MASIKCPPISRELMEHLQRAFPDKLPEAPCASVESFAALVGQQQVIRHLKARFEAQGNTLLPSMRG